LINELKTAVTVYIKTTVTVYIKTTVTVYIRNISQADLQKMFGNKIKGVQACMDARGHHFQQLL